MGRRWFGLAGGLALLALLAGCGGARAPISDAPLAAPAFGDADPVDWPGRTPASYPVHGIDVSRFQGAIDWTRARAAGVSFAFIKATEGGDRLDAGFAGHWEGAGAAGVRRGAYHFFYFCTPAATQARWFIRNVPRTRGALPPVVDLEWNPQSPTCTYRPPPEVVRAEALAFMDILEGHYGQRPIIYTDPAFWERNELWRLDGEEVWLRAVREHPSDAYDGAGWTFWQYSGTGLVPGVAGEADLNAFAGSAASWRAWLAARAP
jgi:lysozyme